MNQIETLKDICLNQSRKLKKVIIYGVYFLDNKEWILHSTYKDKHIASYEGYKLKKQAFGNIQVLPIDLYV